MLKVINFNRKVLYQPNATFPLLQFQMPLEEVERRTLWVTVWHSDMFGRNDFLGEVMLPINTIPLDDPQPRWYSLQDRVSNKANIYISPGYTMVTFNLLFSFTD